MLKFRLNSSCMLASDGFKQACQSLMGNVSYRWSMSVSDGSLIRHVSLQWSMSRSSMGLQTGMSVSDGECQLPMVKSVFDGSPGMFVYDVACQSLWWVSDQACWSLMKHVEVFDGSSIRHVSLRCSMSRPSMGLRSGMSVSNEACWGLWSGMSVSDEPCQGLRWFSNQACQSPIGLRWVSDNNNIYVNSKFTSSISPVVGVQPILYIPDILPVLIY